MASEYRGGGEKTLASTAAITHPTNMKILRTIGACGEASATEISNETGLASTTVGERLRGLREAVLIELAGTRDRRGTRERLYRLTQAGLWLHDSDVEAMTAREQRRLCLQMVRFAFDDLSAALAEAHAPFDQGWLLNSMPALVDTQGWNELREAHNVAVETCEQIRRRALDRLASCKQQDVIRAYSSAFLVKRSPPPEKADC